MGQRQRRPVDRKTLKVWLPWQLHAEFDKWCARAGSSMQYAVRAAVEKLVGYKAPPEESVPSFAAVMRAPVVPVTKPAYVVPPPRQQTQEQTQEEIEAERLQREKLAAEYDPDKMYLYWRNQKGAPRDRAEFRVRTGCKNWGKEWAGVTPELEAQVIVRRDEPAIEEESEGE